MSKQRSVGSLMLLLAYGLALTPNAAIAQATNFAGGPFVPSKTPVVNTTAPQEIPVAPPVQTAPQRVEQPLNLPTFFGNTTITPADTLMRSFYMGELPERPGAGEQRSYRFDDLRAFMSNQGWHSELAEGPFIEPDESNAIIEDSNFIDPALIPTSYEREQSVYKACSFSEGGDKPVIIRVNEASQHFWVFTDTNQFISQTQKCFRDALLSGLKGTVLSSNKDVLTLQKGCLIADSGKSELKIASKVAAIKMGAESTALIDYRPGNSVMIRVLACPNGAKAKVRLAVDSTATYELGAGEELRANLQNGTDDDHITRSTFSLENYINSMPKSISGPTACRFHRMEQHLLKASKADRTSGGLISGFHTNEPVNIVASEGSRFISADNGQVGLLSGRILFHTDAEQIVRTQLGDLYLQEGAAVSVERWKGELRAQCCSGPRSAILVAENFGVPMNWGTEALLVDHEPGWSDAFPNDGVGRRRFEMHKLKSNKCIISDFSMIALIAKAPHLKLLHKNAPEQTRELRNQLFKTAAALQVIAGNKGQYLTQAPATATNNSTSQKTN